MGAGSSKNVRPSQELERVANEYALPLEDGGDAVVARREPTLPFERVARDGRKIRRVVGHQPSTSRMRSEPQ
jgi:hypothetical protein